MIVLLGESACGKSTIEKVLQDKYGYEKVVSCTTRKPRDNESQGVDYDFISDEEFMQKVKDGKFVEWSVYNNWKYGFPVVDDHRRSVAVLTPHGLRQIYEKQYGIFSVYVKVPRRQRLCKILERGDDIDESIRRNISDVGMFDGVEDEVFLCLENNDYEIAPQELAEYIHRRYQTFLSGVWQKNT